MALTPEAMTTEQAKADPVAHAMANWALYPVSGEVPMKQTIPAGMWPWESPLVKGARATAGEDPSEPPKGYEHANEAALGLVMLSHEAAPRATTAPAAGAQPHQDNKHK